jgi:hypothetical protein
MGSRVLVDAALAIIGSTSELDSSPGHAKAPLHVSSGASRRGTRSDHPRVQIPPTAKAQESDDFDTLNQKAE